MVVTQRDEHGTRDVHVEGEKLVEKRERKIVNLFVHAQLCHLLRVHGVLRAELCEKDVEDCPHDGVVLHGPHGVLAPLHVLVVVRTETHSVRSEDDRRELHVGEVFCEAPSLELGLRRPLPHAVADLTSDLLVLFRGFCRPGCDLGRRVGVESRHGHVVARGRPVPVIRGVQHIGECGVGLGPLRLSLRRRLLRVPLRGPFWVCDEAALGGVLREPGQAWGLACLHDEPRDVLQLVLARQLGLLRLAAEIGEGISHCFNACGRCQRRRVRVGFPEHRREELREAVDVPLAPRRWGTLRGFGDRTRREQCESRECGGAAIRRYRFLDLSGQVRELTLGAQPVHGGRRPVQPECQTHGVDAALRGELRRLPRADAQHCVEQSPKTLRVRFQSGLGESDPALGGLQEVRELRGGRREGARRVVRTVVGRWGRVLRLDRTGTTSVGRRGEGNLLLAGSAAHHDFLSRFSYVKEKKKR